MLKSNRQRQILEIINKYEVETQEELIARLQQLGFAVTQATISRDIRELKITKVQLANGRQKYAVLEERDSKKLKEKYRRVLKEGFVSMDMAQNILVVRTVSGMAMAVAAALDVFEWEELAGSIAGDDTIMCAVYSAEDTMRLMEKIKKVLEENYVN